VLQHRRPAAQLAWKETALRALAAECPKLSKVEIAPAVASPVVLGYRNKSKLVAARAPGGANARAGIVLGAYAPRSHDVIDLAGCAIAEPPLDEVAAALGDVLGEAGVAPYDERRLTGTLRYAILRVNARGQVLATLVTATDAFPAGDEVAAALVRRRPEVAGVVQNINTTRGNVLYGDRERTLAGAAAIEDQIGDVRLRVSSRAFLQANRHVARLAYRAIAEATAPAEVCFSGEKTT